MKTSNPFWNYLTFTILALLCHVSSKAVKKAKKDYRPSQSCHRRSPFWWYCFSWHFLGDMPHHYERKFQILSKNRKASKVHIFWEGCKNLANSDLQFWHYQQKWKEDCTKCLCPSQKTWSLKYTKYWTLRGF